MHLESIPNMGNGIVQRGESNNLSKDSKPAEGGPSKRTILRVVLVSPAPPPYGGITNWTKSVTEYFDGNLGLDIELTNVNTAPRKRDLDGRSLFDRVFGGARIIFQSRAELKKLIRQGKADVAHITTSGGLGLFRDCVLLRLCKRSGTKSVLQAHFGRIPEIIRSGGFEKRLLLRAMHLADRVLVLDSKSQKSLAREDIDADSLPNPINIEELERLSGEKRGNTVSYLGWVVKTKGVEELLSSWELVRGSELGKLWELRIAGPYDPEYMAYLKSTYSFDGVVVLGELEHDDAMSLLSESEIFVLPSYTEAFPYVIAEAMTLGCAVVATDVGAVGDMMADGCGVVIERNPESLGDAFLTLFGDEARRKAYGKNARIKACSEYAMPNVAASFADYWRNTCLESGSVSHVQ